MTAAIVYINDKGLDGKSSFSRVEDLLRNWYANKACNFSEFEVTHTLDSYDKWNSKSLMKEWLSLGVLKT